MRSNTDNRLQHLNLSVLFYAKNFIEVIQTSVSLKLNKDRAHLKKLKKLWEHLGRFVSNAK